MSLQGYHRWIDKCNNGLRAQHAYHQWSIGSTPCGFMQPWYASYTLTVVKLKLHHIMNHCSLWQAVSEAEEGLSERLYSEPPSALHPDKSAWSEAASLCAERRVMQVKQSEGHHLESLALAEELDTPDKRTTALAGHSPVHLRMLCMRTLTACGLLPQHTLICLTHA